MLFLHTSKYFEKTIPTGIKHGTITVVINSRIIEVTTIELMETIGWQTS